MTHWWMIDVVLLLNGEWICAFFVDDVVVLKNFGFMMCTTDGILTHLSGTNAVVVLDDKGVCDFSEGSSDEWVTPATEQKFLAISTNGISASIIDII